ncbi:MAG: PIG-L family deacetylase [Planctomycetaceae bacterium]
MTGPDRSSSPPRILALHAHPDDAEYLCGGTLALLRERGCHVTILTMTPGDNGSDELPAAEISRVRREEARRAAEVIGADCGCLEFRDFRVFVDDASRERVSEAVRKARPDVVITHPPADYMCDHEATSRLVRDACFTCSAPNYDTHALDPAPPSSKIPHLYYVDAVDATDIFGDPQPAQFVVDVTAAFDLKRKMFACHESQRAWLKRQHGMDDFIASLERWSASRGSVIGTPYGEGFRQHLGHPYPQDNRLLELISPG